MLLNQAIDVLRKSEPRRILVSRGVSARHPRGQRGGEIESQGVEAA